ncbi:MAG: flavohemoprotein, partial [Psychrobacter urativorans]
LVLISAGVGITPILAMLEAQVTANPQRPVIWAYACQNEQHHGFKAQVDNCLAGAQQVDKNIFYFEEGQLLGESYLATLPKPADIYVCGSMPFMQSMINGLTTLQHSVDSVHYEPFGPKMSLEIN